MQPLGISVLLIEHGHSRISSLGIYLSGDCTREGRVMAIQHVAPAISSGAARWSPAHRKKLPQPACCGESANGDSYRRAYRGPRSLLGGIFHKRIERK